MTVVKYVPLEEANEYADDGEKLRSKLSDNGYLFFRGLLTKTATKARDDIVRILKCHGYVEQNADPAEPTWTGKTPDAAELTVLATGEANRKIGRLRSVGELSKAEEAVRVLERIVGGELFPWVENRDRVRVIGPSQP